MSDLPKIFESRANYVLDGNDSGVNTDLKYQVQEEKYTVGILIVLIPLLYSLAHLILVMS
eukprot:snap_masked-scaffold_47-processed-gene-1.78-mRNA-1 protein AED:1.00 eAED:1.00 QI:0/0/0/0/1/1/2/0/59